MTNVQSYATNNGVLIRHTSDIEDVILFKNMLCGARNVTENFVANESVSDAVHDQQGRDKITPVRMKKYK